MDDAHISAAQEDYLEAIMALEAEQGRARVRDLALKLGVHKSTVTAALKMLTEKGLIDYEPYGRVELKEAGRRAAQRVAGRHDLLSRFLRDVLLIADDVADANACRMEHVMDPVLLKRIEQFYTYLHAREAEDCKWFSGFRTYLQEQ